VQDHPVHVARLVALIGVDDRHPPVIGNVTVLPLAVAVPVTRG